MFPPSLEMQKRIAGHTHTHTELPHFIVRYIVLARHTYRLGNVLRSYVNDSKVYSDAFTKHLIALIKPWE
jgi:hypothetical protein